MPKLALFAACERSIVEQDTKSVSLITLFTGLKLSFPAGEPPPLNAVIPKEWSIVCGWDSVDGDEGKEFVQFIDISLPDGKPFVTKNQVRFTLQGGKRLHQTSKVPGFPIGQIGKCLVQVWAELDGRPVTEKSSLYIALEHEFVAKPE